MSKRSINAQIDEIAPILDDRGDYADVMRHPVRFGQDREAVSADVGQAQDVMTVCQEHM